MNKLSQQELWDKIQNFNFDDPNSSYPFSKKLSSENNWSGSFTQKAIAEYRKFIYLCCISPNGASPSETVDKVWHLHLTYTKNYWEDFCGSALQQQIHHHPSKGGPSEKARHNDWYTQTLELYKITFGTPPPPDVWPVLNSTPKKIQEDIYDGRFLKRVILMFSVAAFLFATLVNLFHTKGPDFLLYFSLICIAGLIATWFTQKNKAQRLQQIVFANMPANCSVYAITRFVYGPHRSYQTAIVDLLKRGIIETTANGYTIIALPETPANNEENPLLLQLGQRYKNGDTFSYLEGMGLVDTASFVHPAFTRLHQLSLKVDYPKLIIPGIVVLIALARILQGIANDKPVGFLVMMTAVFAGICLLILQTHSYTKAVKDIAEAYWDRQNEYGQSTNTTHNFSILGVAALAGFAEYNFLLRDFSYYEPKHQQWTGGEYTSYTGSSCSSGGDGGGCSSGCGGGGCGGCGS